VVWDEERESRTGWEGSKCVEPPSPRVVELRQRVHPHPLRPRELTRSRQHTSALIGTVRSKQRVDKENTSERMQIVPRPSFRRLCGAEQPASAPSYIPNSRVKTSQTLLPCQREGSEPSQSTPASCDVDPRPPWSSKGPCTRVTHQSDACQCHVLHRWHVGGSYIAM
jgi:hypothetical protein